MRRRSLADYAFDQSQRGQQYALPRNPNIVDEGVAWLAGEIARHVIVYLPWLVCVGVGAVLGVLMFGRNYKRRIAELEHQIAEKAAPVVQPVMQNVNVRISESEIQEVREARERIESRGIELDDMKTRVSSLPHVRLSDTATYAELPNGTRVVTLADGSIRLALPVRISATLAAGSPSMSVKLHAPRKGEGSRP